MSVLWSGSNFMITIQKIESLMACCKSRKASFGSGEGLISISLMDILCAKGDYDGEWVYGLGKLTLRIKLCTNIYENERCQH